MTAIGPSRRSCLLRMAASGRSGHKRYFGGPRVRRGRALSRGQATARPSPRTVSAHWGHDRSAKSIGGIRHARFHDANNQDRSHCRLDAAPWQPHQLISGRAPSVRTKILHTRGSSAPRWMGLISRTADKANPASSVTHPSRLWPGSVGQTHSADQAVTTAPVGTLPVSTYRQRAITSSRASAMIMMRRTRPLRSPTRL
jgi:hypothetical protein